MEIDIVNQINQLLFERKYEAIRETLQDQHPRQVADLLGVLDQPSKALTFRLLRKDFAIEVFEYMERHERNSLLESMTHQQMADLLNEMAPDDRTDLFEELPAKVAKHYLSLLSPDERKIANQLLGYAEDSAGRLTTTEFVDLKEDQTVQAALDHIRLTAPNKETIYNCYVISNSRKLVGVITLRELILASLQTRVGDLMHTSVISVTTDTDQEVVARIMTDFGLSTVPVVDSENRLVGIITHDDVLEVIREESTEDIHRMGGVTTDVEDYFQQGVMARVGKRLGWLVVLILLQSFTSSIMEEYAFALETVVALAFFIPLLMDTGGNVGTQSATLVIRGLAVGDLENQSIMQVIGTELLAGLIMGAILAAFSFLRSLFISGQDLMLSITIGLSLGIVVLIANLTGILLPFIARKLKMDPAVMAGPFITTIVDVLGLILYFEIARLLLGIS
ncbi:MAG: magnesium transporter [Limnochordia bacterium]|jgi:magnesium transporter|nr:magnesium transporter [Limnochordia bacterium]MDD2629214.1 magnesium transporter [Limnochordia bacterium]MDD4517649.1 magnesium transporter [Limnochordia bacterium]